MNNVTSNYSTKEKKCLYIKLFVLYSIKVYSNILLFVVIGLQTISLSYTISKWRDIMNRYGKENT